MMAQIIGRRYELNAEIGRGGMGTVYRGRDTQTGQTVAVKKLKPEAAQFDPIMLERFRREAEALARLNHPNITKVLDTVEEGSDHYIVMEYYGGGNLLDVIRSQTPLPLMRALTLAIEIADALTRAHYLDIIHRDIKPANVLIGDDGSPRLTDFGVARFGTKEPVTGIGLVVGTLAYLSPEGLNGEATDARSDIWSFGAMLFEMLTGHSPFEDSNMMAVVKAILTQPVPDLEALRGDCPVEVVDLVNRMLEKSRSARVSSVRLVGAELEQIMKGTEPPTLILNASPANSLPRARFETPTPDAALIRNNLPVQTTPFVGREHELSQMVSLISEPETRLLTILATGGMGKTRLATETALQFVQHGTKLTSRQPLFADGVYFIELAPLTDPAAIVSALAEATGYTFQQDSREPRRQIIDYLREKRMLLVLDNFEHLLGGVMLAADILRTAEHVRIIATSRERLNLQEEILFRLEGLGFPDTQSVAQALEYPAVKLFMQGAKRAQPGYELEDSDLPLVVRICQMVDGVPLPILLASAWLDSLSLAEIADEMRQSIDFLETEARNVPERQRSIRAVFDYSWNLLADDERAALASLSVFRGGCSREAAQAVSGASLRHLTALVNKSLLRRDADSGRYTLHELLRQYLEARLDENPAAKEAALNQHSAYYTGQLKTLSERLTGREATAALPVLDADLENIYAAWRHRINTQPPDAFRELIPTFMLTYEMTGRYAEGVKLFRDSIAQAQQRGVSADHLAIWEMRACVVMLAAQAGERDVSFDDVQPALDVFRKLGSAWGENLALNLHAYAETRHGQYAEAKTFAQQAIDLLQRSPGALSEAITLSNLTYLTFRSGDYDEARRLGELDLQRAIERGNATQMALTHNALGEIFHALHQVAEAKRLFEESYALATAIRNRPYIAYAATNIGNVLHRMAQYDEAVVRYEESLAIHREIGNWRGVAEASNMLAGAWMMLGEYAQAIAYHEQAYRVFEEIGEKHSISDSLVMLSAAESFLGRYESARDHLTTALAIRRELGNPVEIADGLAHLSRVHMFIGDFETSAKLNAEIVEIGNQTSVPALRFPIIGLYNGSESQYRVFSGDFAGAIELSEAVMPHVEASGQIFAVAIAYYLLGRSYAGVGRLDDSEAALRRSIQYFVDSRSEQWIVSNLVEVGLNHAAKGDTVRAVELIGLAHSRTSMPHWIRERAQQQLDRLRLEIPESDFEAAFLRGTALDLDTTVKEILEA